MSFEQEGGGNEVLKKLLENSDLFGTGNESDSGSERDSQPATSQHKASSEAWREEEEESSPPPEVGAKKSGKRKEATKTAKPKKVKKAEVQMIYSDSQKLVRESSVNLPKYQSRMKTLDSFLTKLRNRKPAGVTTAVNTVPIAVAKMKSDALSTDQEKILDKENDPPLAMEENTCAHDHELHTEASCKSDSNLEMDGADENEKLGVEKEESCKETDLTVTQVTEMEGTDRNNASDNEGEPSGDQKDIDAETSNKNDSPKRDSDKKPMPVNEMSKKKQQPTLLTMFAANNAAQLKQKLLEESTPTPLPLPAPSLTGLDEFLLENDEKLTVDVPVVPAKPLTPMERFQQRLMKHVSASSQPVRKEKKSTETEEGENGESVLVPEEVITKLKDKPGAVREHWRSAIRQKLSKTRAEERKAMEEKRKWYSEEMGGETDEEEAELTDGETSDEEYIQNEEAAKADSDICSDFDDDEAEKVEPEADQPTNQDSDDHYDNDGDIDSDDDNHTENIMSQSYKRTTTARRVLDSDSEYENEMESTENGSTSKQSDTLCKAETSSEHMCASSTVSDNTVQSTVLFEDTRDCNETPANLAVQREELKLRPPEEGPPRRSSTLADLEEASMPPLMLNNSMESDDSDSSFADKSEPDGEIKTDSTTPAINEDLGLQSEDARPSSTQPVEEEEEGERDVGGGEQDISSLELSLLWPQPSMPPPAQVRKDSSEELLPTSKRSSLTQSHSTLDGDSQWPVRTYGDNDSISEERLSQDMSVDEETQLLDANGFLCVRTEKKHHPSPFSAIKDSLDPTQESSQSELLALCSGQFAPNEDAQLVGTSSSTTDSIARLFSSREGGITSHTSSNAGFGTQMDTQGYTQMNEVIGLCSGVFPTTQLHPNGSQKSKSSFKLSSRVSSAGTSDGMSIHNSSEEEGERKEKKREQKMSSGDQALLRWAKRQRQLGVGGAMDGAKQGWEGGGESESEDEDMPLLKRRRIRVKHKPSKQERLAGFVESEAELSGSDVGSDRDEEDYLYAGQDYEDDEGAGSDLPLSDSELKEQINKVHMKHTLADDKADLREFKERFLKEGDLYEDGLYMKNGFFRTRHFNRNGSEAGSLDLFADDHVSDGEGGGVGMDGGRVELNSQTEARRRKDRLEREEFIKKFREKEGSLLEMDEDSQSILCIIKDTTSHSLLSTPSVSNKEPLGQVGPRFSGTKRTRGSFLKQTPSTMRRTSSLTPNTVSSTATPTPVGASTGRGFVFQKGVAKPPSSGSNQVEKSSSYKARKSSQQTRPRLDCTISTPPLPADADNSNSIFSILKY